MSKAGYGALPNMRKDGKNGGPHKGPDPIAMEFQAMKRRLTVSLIFTIPLLYLVMGPMVGLPLPQVLRGTENALVNALTQLLLTVPVICVNCKFYRVGVFYNAIGIPVAAGVFYTSWNWTLSPILAAAAMSFSSISVVANALRLRLFVPNRGMKKS